MEKIKLDDSRIAEVTDQELAQATGANGPGWWSTVTDDCPNSVIVCC
ncbi:type A2 lantipeptide [Clostridium estertheticum]|nr:type A2 lanthipeptide [Clostridium estertheticum]MBX4258990.1 type A2 lantipeptide [Clostridium estertheticum]WLC68687.1 type A2 lantipeptide [Clostridium estertheticum]